MSTACLIGFIDAFKRVSCVLCNCDGHLHSAGKTLLEHYTNLPIVLELLSLGDIASLEKFCHSAPGHSYNTPVADHTIYYGRDRGEPVTLSLNWPEKSFRALPQTPYAYLYKGGKWYVSTLNKPEFQELTAEMVERRPE